LQPMELDDPPFAKVNEVTPESPAALCGLQINDLIVHFGSVKQSGGLKAVGELVKDSEDRNIKVVLKRIENEKETVKILSLVPKKWSGRGLLGCHLLPYP